MDRSCRSICGKVRPSGTVGANGLNRPRYAEVLAQERICVREGQHLTPHRRQDTKAVLPRRAARWLLLCRHERQRIGTSGRSGSTGR
jgi:hypothetical protein